jgi:nicotinate-nucleotide adenylyltransferase
VRIALFGGSFNPPHLGHQLACTVALAAAQPAVDELWIVPTARHAFGKPLAPFAERRVLCELAARPFGGRARVLDIEEELDGPSYTLRTVQALRERHAGLEVVIAIGSDIAAERVRWHGWPELRELVTFLVIGRAGAPSVDADADADIDGARDQRVPIELPAVSSTEVRRRLATRASTSGLLDEAVRAHIDARGLYVQPSDPPTGAAPGRTPGGLA